MNVWVATVDEFANDAGPQVLGVYANREAAEREFDKYLAAEYTEEGFLVRAERYIVRDEDDSAGGAVTVTRWLSYNADDDDFESDTWALEERPVQD